MPALNTIPPTRSCVKEEFTEPKLNKIIPETTSTQLITHVHRMQVLARFLRSEMKIE